MPLYEYQCESCGHRFEKIQKFSDPLADTCPKCGGPVHKLMSSPAIQFKGSGFYITDYAKKDHVAAAKADSEKGEKAEKAEKGEKAEKAEKGEKAEKAESKTDAGAAQKADTSAANTESSTAAPAAKETKST